MELKGIMLNKNPISKGAFCMVPSVEYLQNDKTIEMETGLVVAGKKEHEWRYMSVTIKG